MTTWNKVLRALSSRRLSFALLAAWCGLLAIWVIPFMATGLAEDRISSIATSWLPFRIVYVSVVITTIACMNVRMTADIRRAKAVVKIPDSPGRHLAPDLTAQPITIPEAKERLESHGWTVAASRDSLAARRGRLSLLGGSVFHLGIVLFIAAVALYPALSSSADFRLIEGESVGMGQPDSEDAALRSVVADATLIEVAPRYFRDVLLFERLDATWDRADGRRQTFSLASPLWVDPITTVSIQDYGLAPRFVVRDLTGVVQDTTVAMSIFPPGNEDTVGLDAAGLDVTASAFPDYGVVDGRDVSLSYNIKSPRLRVSVSSQSDPTSVIGRGLLAPGESLVLQNETGGSYTLVFEELKTYGSFRIARSWAMLLLVVAGVSMVAGMGVRIWRPRIEIVAWTTEEGLSLAIRADKVGVPASRVVADALATKGRRP